MGQIDRLEEIAQQAERLAGSSPNLSLLRDNTSEAKLSRISTALATIDHLATSDVSILPDLLDVSSTIGPLDGQFLTWDNALQVWVATTAAAGVVNIGDLADVDDVGRVLGDLLEWDGTNWVVATPPTQSKTFTIENPEDLDDFSVWFTDRAITIVEIQVVRTDGTDIDWTLYHGATAHATTNTLVAVTSTSSGAGDSITAFTDETIPADSYITYIQGTTDGVPTEISFTFFYTED